MIENNKKINELISKNDDLYAQIKVTEHEKKELIIERDKLKDELENSQHKIKEQEKTLKDNENSK